MQQETWNSIVNLLCEHTIFRTADQHAVLPLIRQQGILTTYKRNAEILRHVQQRVALGILLSGRAQVTKGSATLSELHVGDLFGAIDLFYTTAQAAPMITAAVSCRVLYLPKALMETIMAADPRIAQNYIQYLSERVYFLTRRIAAFTSSSATDKLAVYLLDALQTAPEFHSVIVVRSFSTLAQELNMGRASLYRAIAALEDTGAIQREGQEIRITDMHKL